MMRLPKRCHPGTEKAWQKICWDFTIMTSSSQENDKAIGKSSKWIYRYQRTASLSPHPQAHHQYD
jgi:hypothetical protein